MDTFEGRVAGVTGGALTCLDIDTMQVNLGLLCNQSCAHCHVEASPDRTEVMGRAVMEQVLTAVDATKPLLVDITGGAPELNPDFTWFIIKLREAGFEVQVRSNLTALLEPGQDFTAGMLAELGVRLVGSMPCYLEENVRAQRGAGVYEKSVEAIRLLNSLGYGTDGGLRLDLVYNPGGPYLPPAQAALEADYKRELLNRFGIVFSNLITITNMPLGRYMEYLDSIGKRGEYLALLSAAFNPGTLDGLMCRHQVSVGWDGTLYDCDFNLALGLPVVGGRSIKHFDPAALARRAIVTGPHCFGCTAGCGSSCRGALV